MRRRIVTPKRLSRTREGQRHLRGRVFTALDLFSGCGGLSQGLKRAGFKVLAAVDDDHPSMETYCLNHRDVEPLEEDIRKLKTLSVKRKLGIRKGGLDLLAGCPPCQGFSAMRTLNGSLAIRDRRNDLLFEFQRFVEDLQPKAVMLENVPGLARDRRFRAFCKKMNDLGYIGKHRVLDAADYGVPQRRRRLIYLAGLGMEVQFGNPSSVRKTVRDAIKGLPKPGRTRDHIHNLKEERTEGILQLIKRIPKNGGSRTDLPRRFQLGCHKACDGFKDVYGRMSWDDTAPTITGGCFNPSKGRFLHPTQNRAITMREAAILQGFPRTYKFSRKCPKTVLAVIIGNALPPSFVASHARSVRRMLCARTSI